MRKVKEAPRLHFEQKLSIRQIAKSSGIARSPFGAGVDSGRYLPGFLGG